MSGPLDQTREGHQQSGHQTEDGEQTDHNGLDQNKTHVRAELVLHKGQREQTGNRRKAASRDLGDGLAQRVDGGLARLFAGGALLGEAVAQDDGVIDRERQLQHQRDGIGDEGDLAHEEVRAHVQQRGRAEGQDQHRDLAVGARGDEQHQDDDHKGDDVHNDHLAVDDHLQRITDLGVDIEVVHAEPFLNLVERGLAGGIVVRTLESHVKKTGELFVVPVGVLKLYLLDIFHALNLRGDAPGLVERDVAHDDLRRVVGDELPIHDIQAETRLGVGRKKMLEAVVRDNERAGIYAQCGERDENDHDQLAPIHDPARDRRHQMAFFIHISSVLSTSGQIQIITQPRRHYNTEKKLCKN